MINLIKSKNLGGAPIGNKNSQIDSKEAATEHINIRIRPSLKTRAENAAQAMKISLSQYIAKLIDAH